MWNSTLQHAQRLRWAQVKRRPHPRLLHSNVDGIPPSINTTAWTEVLAFSICTFCLLTPLQSLQCLHYIHHTRWLLVPDSVSRIWESSGITACDRTVRDMFDLPSCLRKSAGKDLTCFCFALFFLNIDVAKYLHRENMLKEITLHLEMMTVCGAINHHS